MIETAIGIVVATVALVVLGYPFKITHEKPKSAAKLVEWYTAGILGASILLMIYHLGFTNGARFQFQRVQKDAPGLSMSLVDLSGQPFPFWIAFAMMCSGAAYSIAWYIYESTHHSEPPKNQ